MKELPILMSSTMVQAILAGRKTETRRVVKERGLKWLNEGFTPEFVSSDGNIEYLCPYGQPGTVLWVRETWQQRNLIAELNGFDKYYYKADFKGCTDARWKPSIHMPKAAARIWLQVTEIKVERLQDIDSISATAEGAEGWTKENLPNVTEFDKATPRQEFIRLWQHINGQDSFSLNPWVWVVKFKVLSTTGKTQII